MLAVLPNGLASILREAGTLIGKIAIITITIGHLLIDQKGRNLTIVTALIAVLTTVLYQYNITNYNSIASEQSVVLIVQLIYLFVAGLISRYCF